MSNGSPFQVFNVGRSRYSQHAGSVYRYVSTRPSWISRAAAFAFLFVVVLPVAVLVLLAILLAISVFAVLALANAVTLPLRDAVQRLFFGSDPERRRRRPRRRVMMWSSSDAARSAAEQAHARPRPPFPGSTPGTNPRSPSDVNGSGAASSAEPGQRATTTPASDGEGRQNVTVRRPRAM